MKKTLLTLTLLFSSILISISSQNIFNTYQQEMNSAYQLYPEVPRGVLEGWSYTTTLFSHITENEMPSCTGLPRAFGVMGLTENGEGYFRSNLVTISKLSGYSIADIKSNPQKNILAFAAAYSNLLTQFGITSPNPKDHIAVFEALSEIPIDKNPVNNFALNSHIYNILYFMSMSSNQQYYGFPYYNMDLEQVFGVSNYKVLSSTQITLNQGNIQNKAGQNYAPLQAKSTDYGPAIWNAAPSCNFSSRSGTAVSAVTVHTIQGTYAGAISWSQNCSSNVSYHYVVRTSDGQVTQMVREYQKAWHVGSANPYTIGIEHDGYVSNPASYSTALYIASAGISRDVSQSGYGILPTRTFFGTATSGLNTLGACTRIKGHQHFPSQSHTDPGINWDWERYYKLINPFPATTPTTAASGTYYDTGGATGNYSDDERTFFLIQPTGATNVTVTFSEFDLENNWDFMFIYDGATPSSPLIGKYTGTTNPGTLSATGGSILIEFRSDCATTNPGWKMTWNSNSTGGGSSDVTPPTTIVNISGGTWKSTDFNASFIDADNTGGSGLNQAFYQVIDFDGTDWRANDANGFFSDNFDNGLHTSWTSATGTWTVASGFLVQSDEAEGNSNIHTPLNQASYNQWLYHYAMSISGTGTNKRAGIHFMCDDATQTNRGNSYFVYFRTDNNKIQIYKVTNNTISLELDQPFTLNDNQWYDVKIAFDKTSGDLDVWIDNSIAATWTDTSPFTTGNAISMRSGNCNYKINNLKVYHNRSTSELVTVGNASSDARYQNANSSTPAAKVKSITIDVAKNVSMINAQDVNIDWTIPSQVLGLNDGTGADIDNQSNNTQLSANWTASTDANSDIARYWYTIGTTPGGTNTVNWTDNWFNTSFNHTGLNLNFGTTYYVSVKSENGAGLINTEVTSDGVTIDNPTGTPVANFSVYNTTICAGEQIQLTNSSTNATSYSWTTTGGTLSSATAVSPNIFFTTSGAYTISLTATGPGGSNTTQQTINVIVNIPPNAMATPNASSVQINSTVTFTNTSTNANGYYWDFGDGNTSTDNNPWNVYTTVGTYTVMLVAINGSCPNDTTYITIDVVNTNSISEIEGLSTVNIIPNPNQGQFNLILWTNDNLEIEINIFDINGKLIGNVFNKTLSIGKNNIPIKVDNYQLSNGIYNLQIASNSGIVNKRFVVNQK